MSILKHWKIILVIILSLLFIWQYNNNIQFQTKINEVTSNNKAFIIENKNLKNQANLFTFKYDQLKYFNDSINQKLDSVVKDNKIKTKNLKQLQYIKTKTYKTDTIVFKDTLFIKDLKLDTLLVNPGYTLNLKLEYPNKITTTPTFINEQYILFSYKKETVNPPKKFFLLRWFQKKHTVVIVNIINTNKYSNIESRRFIEIIK